MELLRGCGLETVEKEHFTDTRKRTVFRHLSPKEKAALIKENPLYGRVICRCETVTEGEIVEALHRPIVPTSIDAIKRRCNAGMGRCQGGFCGPRVLELISRTRGIDPLDVLQDKAGRLSALMNPLTYVLVNLAVVLIIRQSGAPVNAGTLTQGQVVALVNYMAQILVELVKLANTIFLITKGVACGNRVAAVLDMPAGMEILPEAGTAEQDAACEGSAAIPAVAFRHVELTYPGGGAPSLTDITFTAMPGQTVGIIGGTGSGKTSLVNLIPRFYEATGGSVRVFGRDVRELDPEALRTRIGIVPQKAELFRGTVRSNLLWGTADGQADDARLWAALETAQAADFIRAKQGGLDAPVEQKGRNFSGGQKQRLTIARALVGAPDILILDDSASALDFATDAALRKALRALPGNPTVFIISQRTSSIHACDLILVLEDGHVAGMGTHTELLETCPLYREIHESHFKGGEAQ